MTGTLESPVRVALSAETGEGVDDLLDLVEETLTAAHETLVIELPSSDGAARAWLHQRAEIIDETMADGAAEDHRALSRNLKASSSSHS